jgi:hypothetical protein
VTDQPEPSPFKSSPKSARRQERGRPDGSKVGPPNVDDMPVGGLGIYKDAIRDYSGGQSSLSLSFSVCGLSATGGANAEKKVVSSESMDLGTPRGAKLSARQPVYEDEEGSDQFEDGERPIRPKQTTDYNDRDPEIEPMGTNLSFRSLLSPFPGRVENPSPSFPAGQHPLDGVPNLGELPTPEDLKGLPK